MMLENKKYTVLLFLLIIPHLCYGFSESLETRYEEYKELVHHCYRVLHIKIGSAYTKCAQQACQHPAKIMAAALLCSTAAIIAYHMKFKTAIE